MRSIWPAFFLGLFLSNPAKGETIWIEGENPSKSTMNRHPWWYDQVQKDQLSGKNYISNFSDEKPGQAEYTVTAKSGGDYQFWVRANPVATKLEYQLNRGPWTEISMESPVDQVNLAVDKKPDLRFLAWLAVGKVELPAGKSVVRFRMTSEKHHHGSLDCFVFTTEAFRPRGVRRPGQGEAKVAGADADQWFPFSPEGVSGGEWDLRRLNESVAGENGFVQAKGSQFVLGNGDPVRFWAVNGPHAKSGAELKAEARLLAKYGVNLVRIHGAVFDKLGNFDPKKREQIHAIVAALKAEGIYATLSIYFPLWFTPEASHPWLKGYDGKKHPFAVLYFNETFQEKYAEWWKELLTTPSQEFGGKLIDEPALLGAELINEDSFFFWTFNPGAIPDVQLRILETQFANWAAQKHGDVPAALKAWGNQRADRDAVAAGRLGFRPLWNMFSERSARDKDAARFLAETQRGFYVAHTKKLRDLGFRGLITTSNWTTASPEFFGPIEKYTYTAGDFIDRHGYFDCELKGEFSEWSIRDQHTYRDRSALRFEPGGKRKGESLDFAHPVMDPSYDDKPSMISETTFTRPNRYRSEAPLYYACYGALQGSDAIVHFAFDGGHWQVKPGYFMQPWTLCSPAMLGQFPASALIYRQGYIEPGDLMADITLPVDATLGLAGTPLPQDAALDELRQKDLPLDGKALSAGARIDPLIHYVGRTNVRFTKMGSADVKRKDLGDFIDRDKRIVRSSHGQLSLDYRKGVLTLQAPKAQGLSGNAKGAGVVRTGALEIRSDADLIHIVAVPLDEKDLQMSKRILLQVMTEERASQFATSAADNERRQIESIGVDPWLVRKITGEVRLTRPDAAALTWTPLDLAGNRTKPKTGAEKIPLDATTVYYLIESKE